MATVPVMIISRSNTENKKLHSGSENSERKKNVNNNNVNDKDENCNNKSKSFVIVLDAEVK